MQTKFVISFLSILLSLSSAHHKLFSESCKDCMGYESCQAAGEALNQPSRVNIDLLRSAFCGFDGDKLPMVCCSKLTSDPTSLAGSVENHPNMKLLPDNCGKIILELSDKIANGVTAGLYEYPWMAMIIYRTRQGPQFKCGGSIINRQYVLTAAHCIAGLDLLLVRIGEHDVRSRTESKIQDILIQDAIPHPKYQKMPTMTNDIGLLRLKTPVNFSSRRAGAICLPVSRQLRNRNVGGQYGTVAGWGFTEHGDYPSPELLAVDVPIQTAEFCRKMYNRGRKTGAKDLTINKICAGAKGKDACHGDSGGPLMLQGSYKRAGRRFIQHGIVSYGPKKCGTNFPSMYTDVTKYMKWILDTIEP